ncbi:hypothetical protein QBC46DRAFT_280162, partial [Diplogelasinospora grovesii]
MKITALYVYPIKALRGINLQTASIGPQGVKYDRRFMLYEVRPGGALKKMQLSEHAKCALFEQTILGNSTIVVRYHDPSSPPPTAVPVVEVPLTPDISTLTRIAVNLHGSPASAAYRVGDQFDEFFTSCFGFPVTLVYIGDGKRPVLGQSLLPTDLNANAAGTKQSKGWMGSLSSLLITGSQSQQKEEGKGRETWITFTDVAPLLVTSESSLADVRTRVVGDSPVEMYKFRPNVVVDGEGEDAWAEDFWAELTVNGENRLQLTGNCARCTSLNVDYTTGKPAEGELGQVLKKLMKDRRVDPGTKWSPVFGRYAFPALRNKEGGVMNVAVGDEVEVTKRNPERTVWDWP